MGVRGRASLWAWRTGRLQICAWRNAAASLRLLIAFAIYSALPFSLIRRYGFWRHNGVAFAVAAMLHCFPFSSCFLFFFNISPLPPAFRRCLQARPGLTGSGRCSIRRVSGQHLLLRQSINLLCIICCRWHCAAPLSSSSAIYSLFAFAAIQPLASPLRVS